MSDATHGKVDEQCTNRPRIVLEATHDPQVTYPQSHSTKCGLQVTVVRNGQTEEISTADLLVGDVMLMDTGDILPADGLLFQGNDIRQAFRIAMPLFAQCGILSGHRSDETECVAAPHVERGRCSCLRPRQ